MKIIKLPIKIFCMYLMFLPPHHPKNCVWHLGLVENKPREKNYKKQERLKNLDILLNCCQKNVLHQLLVCTARKKRKPDVKNLLRRLRSSFECFLRKIQRCNLHLIIDGLETPGKLCISLSRNFEKKHLSLIRLTDFLAASKNTFFFSKNIFPLYMRCFYLHQVFNSTRKL